MLFRSVKKPPTLLTSISKEYMDLNKVIIRINNKSKSLVTFSNYLDRTVIVIFVFIFVIIF